MYLGCHQRVGRGFDNDFRPRFSDPMYIRITSRIFKHESDGVSDRKIGSAESTSSFSSPSRSKGSSSPITTLDLGDGNDPVVIGPPGGTPFPSRIRSKDHHHDEKKPALGIFANLGHYVEAGESAGAGPKITPEPAKFAAPKPGLPAAGEPAGAGAKPTPKAAKAAAPKPGLDAAGEPADAGPKPAPKAAKAAAPKPGLDAAGEPADAGPKPAPKAAKAAAPKPGLSAAGIPLPAGKSVAGKPRFWPTNGKCSRCGGATTIGTGGSKNLYVEASKEFESCRTQTCIWGRGH